MGKWLLSIVDLYPGGKCLKLWYLWKYIQNVKKRLSNIRILLLFLTFFIYSVYLLLTIQWFANFQLNRRDSCIKRCWKLILFQISGVKIHSSCFLICRQKELTMREIIRICPFSPKSVCISMDNSANRKKWKQPFFHMTSNFINVPTLAHRMLPILLNKLIHF